jgi:hypothetical protein
MKICLIILAYRQWSNRVSLCNKMILLCTGFWFLLIGHRLILYKTSAGQCIPLVGFYEAYDTYFELIFASICPPIVMFILAYLLIKSVRSVNKRRIIPINNSSLIISTNHSVIKQIDAHLTLMLILQSSIAVITYVPYSANLAYTQITLFWPKSNWRIACEDVFQQLAHLFSYVFFATSFYVSFLTNNGFRKRIKRLLKIEKDTEHRQNQINTIQMNRIIRN